MRHLNLIFQGGGVKGIAYAGALQAMPKDFRIRGVGGTSAGAIVAALLAIGKRGDALEEILKDRTLFQLLRAQDAERYIRVKDMIARRDEWSAALRDGIDAWSANNDKSWFKTL